jgi:uncharacterized protein (DUF2384 family)
MGPQGMDESPPLCPAAVGRSISLPLDELAAHAGMDADVMLEHFLSPTVQQYLRGIIEVHDRAIEVFGDGNAALAWMLREPIRALENQTAIVLIAEGCAPDVLCYVDGLAE